MTSRFLETVPPTIAAPDGVHLLHEYHLAIGSRYWRILHTGVVLTFEDERHYLRHTRENLPYGVALWPSSIALAHALAGSGPDLRENTVLELGAGTGLPGIVAASHGASVVQTDRHELPLEICRRNAAVNHIDRIEHISADWALWQETRKFDLIIGSDILYTEALQPFLTSIFTRNLAPNGRILLADPFRARSVGYLANLESGGWTVEGTRWTLGEEEDPRPIGVFELTPPAPLPDSSEEIQTRLAD